MLTVVGEIGAEQLGVATGGGETDRRRGADDVSAERDVDVAEDSVLTQAGVMRTDVHHVVGPVGDPDDPEGRRVADDDLDVVGVGSAAAQVDDDDGPDEFFDSNLQVPVSHCALTGTGDLDLDGLGHLGVTRDGDDGGFVERREGLGRNTVGGYTALSEPFVAPSHVFDGDARAFGDLDGGGPGGRRGSVVQTPEPLQRCEAPDFVAAARHLECVDVERGEELALVGGQG